MNFHPLPDDPRLLELLAGHVIGDLDHDERRELQQLAATHKIDLHSIEYSDLDLAAGTVVAAHTAGSPQPLPDSLRSQLVKAGEEFLASRGMPHARFERDPSSPIRFQQPGGVTPGSGWLAWTGWLAAAAAVVFAVVVALNRPAPPSIDDFLRNAPDLVRAQWGDWDSPEIPGVKGEVVWSDDRQTGYMRFTGLPANNPDQEQYQLWIVDERGLVDPTGQSARISGGVFDVPSDGGPVLVPINPAIKVGKAQLFAVTIEKPGGTWVSDMTRRVSIAAVSRS